MAVCIEDGWPTGGLGSPPRTRKAAGTHPTGMLSGSSLYPSPYSLVLTEMRKIFRVLKISCKYCIQMYGQYQDGMGNDQCVIQVGHG